jgi:hypothetical protein
LSLKHSGIPEIEDNQNIATKLVIANWKKLALQVIETKSAKVDYCYWVGIIYQNQEKKEKRAEN